MATWDWVRTRLLASRPLQNVGANLIGGVWNGALIVVATPWLTSLLTLEGYGLVGFWLVMQVLLSLFDFGFGATIVREFADSSNTPEADQRRADLLHTFERIYWALAFVIGLVLFAAAGWLSTDWLHLKVFPPRQVATAIRFMALSLALQFPSAVYAGGLSGLQAQGRLNALQMAGNTGRYIGGVAILFWRPDPVWFFAVQAVVAGAQTLAMRMALVTMLAPAARHAASFRQTFVGSLWRYSAGMAFTSVGGMLLGNIDRMVVSRVLPAEELGKYSLAFTATGLIQMGIQPFYRAYFPRFSELHATGDREGLMREYYRGCRAVAAMVIPIALIGWVFAPQLFAVWIGHADPVVVRTFRWLVVAIGCTGLMWLPAALQQAQGWTSLHGTMILAAVVVGGPLMFWTIPTFGTAGAAIVWVIHGVSGVTVELWLMHRRLLRGELGAWYRAVIFRPLAVAILAVAISAAFMPSSLSRWPSLAWVGITAALTTGGSVAISFGLQRRLISRFN
jgi:O-antigen/teichoic acid export membrane protein